MTVIYDKKYRSDRYELPKTDHSKWYLKVDSLGVQNWIYDSAEGEFDLEASPSRWSEDFNDQLTTVSQPCSTDKQPLEKTRYTAYQLDLPEYHENSPRLTNPDYRGDQTPDSKLPASALQSALNGFEFLKTIQDPAGTWPCQYGGPMFMLIGYVAARYFTKVPIAEEVRIEIIRYLVNTAHEVDGGWGLHTEDKSTCFGTTINYVILRLLGMDPQHPVMAKARLTLHALGGAIGAPHWGKSWLAVLNLYEWSGVNPCPPELWMLPYWLPLHPGRWWVHTRAIYLPLGYLSCRQAKCPLDPLLESIRDEIYVKKYETINFADHRNTVCGIDLYYPHTKILNMANEVLTLYEKYRPKWIQRRSLKYSYDLIKKEIYNTDSLCIAPVNMAFNAIVVYMEEGPQSAAFQRFLYRWPDFLYMSPKGMMLIGTNGVQVWDVAFSLQYACIAGIAHQSQFQETIRRGFNFLVRSQFTEDTAEGSYRDPRIGGWPFSTKTQGYTVSDCTAEALKAIIMVQNNPGFEDLKGAISQANLNKAIDVLLMLQNKGSYHYGSFSSYEAARATPLLEKLNPAEVFGNIMVEYPYVECTDSTVLGLAYFRKHYDYRGAEIDEAIRLANAYIESSQNPDGGWFGSWGVCYTYASMFAIEALSTQGKDYNNNQYIRRGCDFLAIRQEADGGWAESFRSCEIQSYVRGQKSEVVQTAWALIALLLSEYPDRTKIDKAARFLIEHQREDGGWNQDEVEGVFNHSCAIEYPNYRYYFPIKALGMYAKRYDPSTVTLVGKSGYTDNLQQRK